MTYPNNPNSAPGPHNYRGYHSSNPPQPPASNDEWAQPSYGGEHGYQPQNSPQYSQQQYGPQYGQQPTYEAPPKKPSTPPLPLVSGKSRFDAIAPISVGFRNLNSNIGPWLGVGGFIFGMTMLGIGIILLSGMASSAMTYSVVTSRSMDYSTQTVAVTFAGIIPAIGFFIFGTILWLSSVIGFRGGLLEMDGAKPTFGQCFESIPWGRMVGTFFVLILFTLIPLIPYFIVQWVSISMLTDPNMTLDDMETAFFLQGTVLPILAVIDFIVIVFLLPIIWLAPYVALEGRTGAWGCVGETFSLLKKRYWPVLGSILMITAIRIGGYFLCFLGSIYTVPFAGISTAHIYRQLTEGTRPMSISADPGSPNAAAGPADWNLSTS